MSPIESSAAPSAPPVALTDSIRTAYARALRLAVSGQPVDLSSLQTLVCEYVRAAKERGEPPERVIVALKLLMVSDIDRFQQSELQQSMRDAMLTWCLDEYYGPESGTLRRAGAANPVYRKPRLTAQ